MRTTYGAHEEREGDGLLGARHGEIWIRGFDARGRDGMGAMLLGSTQFVRSFDSPSSLGFFMECAKCMSIASSSSSSS